LLYNKYEKGDWKMKKLIVLFTAIALVTSCAVIDPRVTGKRVVVAPDEEYESPYYEPYAYAGPMISFGIGLWLSPFYWGSWWGPWGYPGWGYWWGYPGYGWGYYPGWGYPGYGWGYWPGYGYPYYRGNRIYKGQLRRGSTTKSGTRRSIKRGTTSRGYSGGSKVTKSGASGVRSGSSGRVSSSGSRGTGTRVKKK
jgi:hypothetical protein